MHRNNFWQMPSTRKPAGHRHREECSGRTGAGEPTKQHKRMEGEVRWLVHMDAGDGNNKNMSKGIWNTASIEMWGDHIKYCQVKGALGHQRYHELNCSVTTRISVLRLVLRILNEWVATQTGGQHGVLRGSAVSSQCGWWCCISVSSLLNHSATCFSSVLQTCQYAAVSFNLKYAIFWRDAASYRTRIGATPGAPGPLCGLGAPPATFFCAQGGLQHTTWCGWLVTNSSSVCLSQNILISPLVLKHFQEMRDSWADDISFATLKVLCACLLADLVADEKSLLIFSFVLLTWSVS